MMRTSEQIAQLQAEVAQLRKEVDELKAGQTTVTLEGEPIGKVAPTKKTAGTAGQKAKKTTGK